MNSTGKEKKKISRGKEKIISMGKKKKINSMGKKIISQGKEKKIRW